MSPPDAVQFGNIVPYSPVYDAVWFRVGITDRIFADVVELVEFSILLYDV